MTDRSKTKTSPSKSEPSACSLPSHAEQAKGIKIEKPDEDWQRELNDEQYRVLRQHGTEPPFRNAFWNAKEAGIYVCAGCGAPLFGSSEKYNSGTGWPSFRQPAASENVGESRDDSYGMIRTEVHCNQCGGHLGHVFDDGPAPTGLRYCINSASLELVPKDQLSEQGLESLEPHAK